MRVFPFADNPEGVYLQVIIDSKAHTGFMSPASSRESALSSEQINLASSSDNTPTFRAGRGADRILSHFGHSRRSLFHWSQQCPLLTPLSRAKGHGGDELIPPARIVVGDSGCYPAT